MFWLFVVMSHADKITHKKGCYLLNKHELIANPLKSQ